MIDRLGVVSSEVIDLAASPATRTRGGVRGRQRGESVITIRSFTVHFGAVRIELLGP